MRTLTCRMSRLDGLAIVRTSVGNTARVTQNPTASDACVPAHPTRQVDHIFNANLRQAQGTAQVR